MATAALLLRRELVKLDRDMQDNLAGFWRSVETANDAAKILHDVLPDLIDAYGTGAAALAADWYDDLRERAEVPKRFTAIPGDIADTGTHALIGWALNEATTDDAFKALILGGSQRRVANFARLTVTGSSVADPSARGWQRTGVGECDFCSMLLGRGAVYSEETADFEAHDSCKCGAEPVWL